MLGGGYSNYFQHFKLFSSPSFSTPRGCIPQTCSNTLELPNYYHSMLFAAKEMGREPPTPQDLIDHIEYKLHMAINEQGGYGLDTSATDGPASSRRGADKASGSRTAAAASAGAPVSIGRVAGAKVPPRPVASVRRAAVIARL